MTDEKRPCPRCGCEKVYALRSRGALCCTSCKYQFPKVDAGIWRASKIDQSTRDKVIAALPGRTMLEASRLTGVGYKTVVSIKEKLESSEDLKIDARREQGVGEMCPASMGTLEELIVRPGIEEKFTPLRLYRGNSRLGDLHRKWNLALMMMQSNANCISEGTRPARSEEFTKLCGPVGQPQSVALWMFFGRLRDNPDVTDNIVGLSEYVEHIHPGPSNLIKVPFYGSRSRIAPWRVFQPKQRAERPFIKRVERPAVASMFYPYLRHDPKNPNGDDLSALVNQAVPAYFPNHIRADICQDLIVSLLMGTITKDEVRGSVKDFTRKVMKMHPLKYGPLSLDAPLYADSNLTLADVLDEANYR